MTWALEIGDVTQPSRVVPLSGGAVQLASGPLPLRSGPPSSAGPWGMWVSAPEAEPGIDQVVAEATRGLAAGATCSTATTVARTRTW